LDLVSVRREVLMVDMVCSGLAPLKPSVASSQRLVIK
jgi:hypothetical protein